MVADGNTFFHHNDAHTLTGTLAGTTSEDVTIIVNLSTGKGTLSGNSVSHANNATNANHSTTADALGKVRVVHADFRENANTAERDLFSAGGLKLSASCDSSGNLNFKWTSLVDHSTFRSDVVGGSTNSSTSPTTVMAWPAIWEMSAGSSVPAVANRR